MGKQRVPRTHNGGTMTKAEVMQAIRSVLRRNLFRYNWIPRKNAWERAKRPAERKGAKWEYQCASCRGWFLKKQCEADHVTPCGPMTELYHIPEWLERYLCEEDEGWQILCKGKGSCHQEKTNQERKARR